MNPPADKNATQDADHKVQASLGWFDAEDYARQTH